MRESLKKSGIDIVGDVPWGTHFCQFYQTKEDLMDILIPYFQAGLENNEFCLWVMSQPLEVEEAKEALKKVVPDIDVYLERGQIEIIPYTNGYVNEGVSGSEKVINGWVKKIDPVLASVYEGLRTAGNTSWLKKGNWDDFVDYEKKVYASIGKRQMISLYSYFLDICSVADIADIIEVAFNHQFALVKKEGKWERIENFGRKNITESKREEEALCQNEQRISPMLENIPSPSRETANLELAEILDVREIQSLMDDLYKLANIPIGIIDLKGNVLVSVGWQDICTKFHRVHPEACKHCVESDTTLSSGILPGKFKSYKCKNNMWDIATPIIVGGQHVGNIFLGQFFFEGEPIDYELFRSQARQYGFNEEKYIAELEKVPRLSREVVNTIMAFFMKLSNMLSHLGYSNIKLTQSLAERDTLLEALRKSESKYRHIIETSQEGVWIIDRNDLTVFANQIFSEMLGYSIDEIIGQPPQKFLSLEFITVADDRLREHRQRVRQAIDYRLIKKDGSDLWCIVSTHQLSDDEGKYSGSLGMLTDITERKHAEEALIRSEERFRKVFNQAATGIAIHNLETGCQEVNNRLCDITGYSREELISKSPYMLVHPDDQEEFAAEINSFQKGETSYFVKEMRNIRADGRIIWVRLNASFLNYSGISKDSQPTVINIMEDITELKKAEEALKLSNLYNRSLIEACLDPLVTIGYDGKITDVNGATEQVTEYSRNELIKTDFSDYFTEPEKARKGYQQVFTDGEVRNYPLEIQHQDGHITPVLYNASVYRDENGEIIGIFASARDITERKHAEEVLKKAHHHLEVKVKERTEELEKAYNSLKESEGRLAEAQKMAHIGNWEWDVATDKAYWSEEMYCIFKRDPQKLAPSLNEYLSYIHPDDLDYYCKVNDYTRKVRTSGLDFRIVLANGEERTLHIKSDFIFNDENIPIRVKGIVQDITESKKADEKIQTLAKAVESSNDAIVTEAFDNTIASWNKAAEQIYGYSAQEILGKNVSILEPDNIKGEIKRFSEKIIQGEKIQHYETSRLKKDGTIINVSVTLSPIFGESGKLVALSAIVRDITEHKRAEEALRESEARLRRFYESGMFGVLYYNLDGTITDANDKFLEIVGFTREDLQAGQVNWNKMTPPEYRLLDEHCIAELKSKGLKAPYEKEYIRKDGSRVPIILGIATFDQEGLEGIAFVIDITKNKQGEHRIRRYYNILEGINRIFGSVVRAETEEELGNVCLSVALEVTESQVGFAGEVGVGGILNGITVSNMEWAQKLMYETDGNHRPLGDFVLHDIYGRIVDSGKSFFTNDLPSQPNSMGLTDSHLQLASLLGVPLVSEGKTIGLIAVANREGGYSCEQQEDLEAIAPAVIQALQRKRGEKVMAEIDKIRIKEIHHRIKNNLQVISSLLDLQAEKFIYKRISPTPEVLKAFKESQDRIISMALIHEELYKGGGDDTLDFSAYLRKLAENLFQTYIISSKNVRLCMNLEENALFDMDVAVPLGIIVNELISNSLKHAFLNRYGGEIRIRLRREEKNNEISKSLFSLTVSDNGKGIPDNLELENLESLGLQLVNILVDQLDGEIELKREHGTEFRITFNVAERS